MVSFKKFLLEAQQGFVYETNVANVLSKYGWVPKGYKPARAESDRPDLDIFIKGKSYGTELKMVLASAGSLVIHYTGATKSYSFGNTENKKEKEFLKALGEDNNVLQEIKKQWKVEPFLQIDRDDKWAKKVIKSKLTLQQRYEHDLANLRDIKILLPNDSISKYYNLKDCFYLNVGTHGFYTLGTSDPAGFNKCNEIPNWDDNHQAFLRIRVQSKGTTQAAKLEQRSGWPNKGQQGYQLVMEIQFKTVTKSNFNIGPIIPPGPVIDVKALKLPNICK